MNALHKAFQVLGLEPGTAFPQVKKRYRRLVIVWHPDRMNNEEARKEAEEELKKINDAFEKLKKHFESQHVNGPGCSCQSGATSNTRSNRSNSEEGSSRNYRSRTDEWQRARRKTEEAAKERSQERDRQQSEERTRREAEQAARRATEFQTTIKEALQREALRRDEELRWKISLALLVTLFSLIGICWLGFSARTLAKSIESHWKNETPPLKRGAQKRETRNNPRIIKIYNRYCPHHHHHTDQSAPNQPTRDPYLPTSETWKSRQYDRK